MASSYLDYRTFWIRENCDSTNDNLNIVGDFKIYAEGEGTTGAGLIQNLKNDSFCIIHDEVDKSLKTKEELRFELGIARSSSSSRGNLLKGTADQTGRRYSFNSMFCFSSINHLLEKNLIHQGFR
jgi:hypothetical protein